MTKMKTKLSEIARIECGTGADITDEDNYWVSFDATDDLERPVVVTVLIAKGTPIPVVCTLLEKASEVLIGESIYEDEDEADTHIGAN